MSKCDPYWLLAELHRDMEMRQALGVNPNPCALLSLLLPCLLAEMWLAPGSAPGSQLPEAQAGLQVPQTPPPRSPGDPNKTGQGVGAQVEAEEAEPWLMVRGRQLSKDTSNRFGLCTRCPRGPQD